MSFSQGGRQGGRQEVGGEKSKRETKLSSLSPFCLALVFRSASSFFSPFFFSFKMYLMYTLDEQGKRVYTLKVSRRGRVKKDEGRGGRPVAVDQFASRRRCRATQGRFYSASRAACKSISVRLSGQLHPSAASRNRSESKKGWKGRKSAFDYSFDRRHSTEPPLAPRPGPASPPSPRPLRPPLPSTSRALAPSLPASTSASNSHSLSLTH